MYELRGKASPRRKLRDQSLGLSRVQRDFPLVLEKGQRGKSFLLAARNDPRRMGSRLTTRGTVNWIARFVKADPQNAIPRGGGVGPGVAATPH